MAAVEEQEDLSRDLYLIQIYRQLSEKGTLAAVFGTAVQQLTEEGIALELPSGDPTEEMFVNTFRPAIAGTRMKLFIQRLATISGVPSQGQVNTLRFDMSADSLKLLTQEYKKEMKEMNDRLATLPDDQLTIENVLIPNVKWEQESDGIENCIQFLSMVSPQEDVRKASTDCEKDLGKFGVEQGMREDVFKKFKTFAERVNRDELPPEWVRWIDRNMRDFRRAGLDLPEETRDQVKTIKKRMTELSSTFQQNLNEENAKFEFSAAELEGMDEDFLNFRKSEEKEDVYTISLKYPDYFPIQQRCKVEATRRKLEFEFSRRCYEENTRIIEELVQLRFQQAQLMSYPTHNDFVLEVRMAKEAQKVMDFLQDLNARLQPLGEQDLQAILALKEGEKRERGEEFDGKINAWDYRYYVYMREKQEYQVDHELIKTYFPVDKVVGGALQIYQDLLSLKFEEVATPDSPWKLWHESVQLFQVVDKATNKFYGHFFLDLYPRDGKYGHACMCSLQPGCAVYNDAGEIVERQYPVNAMLCNFPEATADKPALLTHSDVVTFFHEFGHVMHQICGQPDLVRFAGTRVERDFVEAPSQMLENWCWQEEGLRRMSGHYERPEETLPKELIDKLVAAKNANAGLFNKRQLVFGILDQTMHSQPECNTSELCARLSQDIMGIPQTPDTNFTASFGHLAGGYDSSYYGYMWSEVYSADMFYTKFGAENLMSPESGLEYRNKILAPGGSRDAMELLVDFLGREPTLDAFLKDKGL